MKLWHKIVLGTVAISILGAGGTAVVMQPEPIRLESPSKVKWDKPKTDAEWAEDVKRENFDIKSTGKLNEMIVAQTTKLEKQEAAFDKYADMVAAGDDPVRYIFWQKREQLRQSYPDMPEQELNTEAQNAAQTEYNQQQWEIEKIKQGIERMNKEIELRQKGFVVVEGEEQPLFGSFTKPYAIRRITD